MGQKAAPKTEGSLAIPTLKETVRVFWGPYAVPHIHAANELDLLTAQGYLHAQERLWQMDLNRRFFSGRVAETFGENRVPWKELSVQFRDKSTADLDYFIRLMGILRTSRAALRILPETLMDRLEAYCRGVNRYIETRLRSLPVEFRLLRYEPEPWRPEDCLTISKGFALFLTTSFYTRLALSAISERLQDQPAKLKSLFPSYPESGPTIARFDAGQSSEASQGLFRFLSGSFAEWGLTPDGQGSNNWVIAPHRSSTGKPILCNDPHLRMTLPSIWHLVHLKAEPSADDLEGLDVWGASIPGSPFVYLGQNRWIAWGVTAALCDDADLYLEKIDPKDPDLYLAGEHWQRMESEEERIKVRGGKEIRRMVRFTRHGPLLSDLVPRWGGQYGLALRWTAHDPGEEMRALYGVNRARNWGEFLEGLSFQVAPTLNYVFADAQGNIGYTLAGRVPLRPGPASLLPVPGWSGEHDWKGHIPFSELPRLYNPPQGVIATANNKIVDGAYPYYLSDLFDPPYRIQRIEECLSAKEKFSLEDMGKIQMDGLSVQAREMIRDLRDDLEQIAHKDSSLKGAVERLIGWNGDCSEQSVEAALSHVLHQRLMRNLLEADLGPELYLAYVEILNQALVPVEQILRDPHSPWFDSSPRLSLVEKSLREACDELAEKLGKEMDQWEWQRLHTLTLRHPLDRSKILAPIFSIGPFPASGDAFTINMGFYRHSNPYSQIVGASLRMILDLGERERSLFILPSGQSGHFFSSHYNDQTPLWRAGDYIRLYAEKEATRDWPLLVLTPREP